MLGKKHFGSSLTYQMYDNDSMVAINCLTSCVMPCPFTWIVSIVQKKRRVLNIYIIFSLFLGRITFPGAHSLAEPCNTGQTTSSI